MVMKSSTYARRVLATLVAATLLFFAGSSQALAVNPTAKSKFKKPVVKTFVWEQTPTVSLSADEVYVQWLVVLYNPNKTAYGEFPTIRITARDAEGRILASEEETLMSLPPRRSIAMSSQLSARKVPASVTAAVVDGDFKASKSKPAAYKPFPATNLGIDLLPLGGFDLSGEVTNPFSTAQDVGVTVAVKDAAGNIIGGAQAYLDGLQPKVPTPFFIEDVWTWANGAPVSAEAFVGPRGMNNAWDKVAAKK